MKFLTLFVYLAFPLTSVVSAQSLSIFLDKNKPSTSPTLFAPDIISNKYPNRDFTISPNGDEIYYTIQNQNLKFSTIVRIKRDDNDWSKPEVVNISGIYSDLEPFLSQDGTSLYFSSNRPINDSTAPKDYNIWVAHKNRGGEWGAADLLSKKINTENDEFYPSVASSGNLYFTSTRKDGQGKEDIFMSEFKNGEYQTPIPLSDSINGDKYEFNAFVSPDESLIIFSSYGRTDGKGGGDLYYSFKDKNNKWRKAQNMDSINSKFLDYCPYLDLKKNILYFTSNRHNHKLPFQEPLTIDKLNKTFEKNLNGHDNIYWMQIPDYLKLK